MGFLVRAWPKCRNRDENPYNFLVYRDINSSIQVEEFDHRSFNVKGADILHVHWPDRLLDDKRKWRLVWRFNRFLNAIKKLHKQGGKLVWTVHNLRSREIQFPELADKYLKSFIGKVDGLIFLTEKSKEVFFNVQSPNYSVQTRVVPHPHYRDIYESIPKEFARQQSDIPLDNCVVGFFGKIRNNKGLETLVSSFEAANITPHTKLMIAGSPDKRGLSETLSSYLKNNKGTIAKIGHINESEVAKVICACDVLIFPYQDILNSGSAMLALSLGRPIIAPNIGSFPELKDKVGSEWVYLYDQPLDTDKLLNSLSWLKNRSKNNNEPNLDFAEPVKIAALTESFYRQILNLDN